MNKRLLCMAILLALSSPIMAAAQVHAAVLSDADQAVLVAIGRYLNALQTLRGRFLQVAPDGVTTLGSFWLDRPGRMRFQYDPPSPLLLVAGHGTVIFHDSKLDQTTSIPVNQTPLGLLLGDTISLSGDVTATDFQKPPGQVQITLVRTRTPGDGSLTLQLNANPMALVGWSVVDAEGKETQIRLSDVQAGGTYDQSLFTFSDPDAGK